MSHTRRSGALGRARGLYVVLVSAINVGQLGLIDSVAEVREPVVHCDSSHVGCVLPNVGWELPVDREQRCVVRTTLGLLKADQGMEPDPVECDRELVFDVGRHAGRQVRFVVKRVLI
jgi:hypothetical protein